MWHHFNYEAAAEMRRKYIPVDKVLEVADISPEETIMDVGGGDGFYTLLFSKYAGKVIYVDPSEPAVSMVNEKVGSSRKNIEILKEDICSLDLPDGVTKIFFSNSFHDIPCRKEILEKFSTASNGTVEFVLVEFKKDADIGPPVHIKISPDELDLIFSSIQYSPLHREIFEKHYVTRFGKKTS